MKNSMRILIALVVVLFVTNMVAFTVNEIEQAVVIHFGKPVRVIREPGLYFKLPDPIQKVQIFTDRLKDYDSPPSTIPTNAS